MAIAFACRNTDYTVELTYKSLNIYEKNLIIEKANLQKKWQSLILIFGFPVK